MIKKIVFVPCIVACGAVLWTVYRYLKKDPSRYLRVRDKEKREIVIVTCAQEWEEIYPKLAQNCQTIKAVGFDCEWVFWGMRLPVALIQLATHDGLCVLVRIFMMRDDIPDTLSQLLSDKSILKVGVASKDDGKKLMQDYGIEVNGCVDLRHILARVRGLYNRCPNESLFGLAKGVLGITLTKNQKIRCGNWEAEVFSPEQISYAADDALIGLDIFLQLVLKKIQGPHDPCEFYGDQLAADEAAFWYTARSLCQGIVDAPYKRNQTMDLLDVDDRENYMNERRETMGDMGAKGGKPMVVKGKTSQKAFMARKRPLYYNCVLYAPDGKVLTTCDIRKAQWYIDKGLGHKIKDDPLWVQLNFEPAKRPTSDQDYYLQDKENICVVCGATKEYIRKLIVPQEYRKFFPSVLKDHSSHDVLLLCIPCHLRSANYDNALRQRLATECDAPLDSGKDSRKMRDQDLQKVVSAAKALSSNKDKIPAARVQELEETVKNFYGVGTLNEQLLQDTMSIDYRVKNSNFVPHGKKVVLYYMKKEGGLLEFEKIWRRQFVETMNPKFLPPLWSIEHKPERLQPLTAENKGQLESDSFM